MTRISLCSLPLIRQDVQKLGGGGGGDGDWGLRDLLLFCLVYCMSQAKRKEISCKVRRKRMCGEKDHKALWKTKKLNYAVISTAPLS